MEHKEQLERLFSSKLPPIVHVATVVMRHALEVGNSPFGSRLVGEEVWEARPVKGE